MIGFLVPLTSFGSCNCWSEINLVCLAAGLISCAGMGLFYVLFEIYQKERGYHTKARAKKGIKEGYLLIGLGILFGIGGIYTLFILALGLTTYMLIFLFKELIKSLKMVFDKE